MNTMKKEYSKPVTESLCVYALCGPGWGNGGVNGSGGLAKTREDEDEEAYAVTGGEGEANYGDLW